MNGFSALLFASDIDIFARAREQLTTASGTPFDIASPMVIVVRQGSAVMASMPLSCTPIHTLFSVFDPLIHLPVDMDGVGSTAYGSQHFFSAYFTFRHSSTSPFLDDSWYQYTFLHRSSPATMPSEEPVSHFTWIVPISSTPTTVPLCNGRSLTRPSLRVPLLSCG